MQKAPDSPKKSQEQTDTKNRAESRVDMDLEASTQPKELGELTDRAKHDNAQHQGQASTDPTNPVKPGGKTFITTN